MEIQDYPAFFKRHFKRTSSFVSGIALMFVDAVMLMLSIGAGFFIVNLIDPSCIVFRSFVRYAVYLPEILIVFYAASLYPGILLASQDEVKRFSLCSFFSFIGIAISISIRNDPDQLSIAIALLVAWPFATFFLPVGREIARHAFGHFKWWGVPAVIYSHEGNGHAVVDRLTKKHHFGYIPALILSDKKNFLENYDGVPVFAPGKEVFDMIKKLRIKVAILCDYSVQTEEILTYYRYVIRVPKNQNFTNMSLQMRDFGGILGFSSTNYLTKHGSVLLKRMIDIFICLLAFPIVLLLTIFISIIIKIESPGPVFYGHKRIGKKHREIKCWKFRSMISNADEALKKILENDPVRAKEWEKDRKFSDDPRVTKFGKFLRKTSLDELPQLWNIFIGEMSFVGPRPVTESELEKYGKYADYVLTVPPGLSGMWQTSGRSDTGYEERINLDTYYIQNWSIWLDIWIIIKTIWVVLIGRGAY